MVYKEKILSKQTWRCFKFISYQGDSSLLGSERGHKNLRKGRNFIHRRILLKKNKRWLFVTQRQCKEHYTLAMSSRCAIRRNKCEGFIYQHANIVDQKICMAYLWVVFSFNLNCIWHLLVLYCFWHSKAC